MSSEFATLLLEESWFGIPLSALREVIEPLPATPVPAAPAEIRGVINLRGELVPLLLLDHWLEFPIPNRRSERRNWFAVFSTDGYVFAVPADQASTARIERDEIEPWKGPRPEAIEGTANRHDPPFALIRPGALLSGLEAALIRQL